MLTKSYTEPARISIALSNDKASIFLCENITQKQISKKRNRKLQKADVEETENVYVFNLYSITVPNREGLFEDIENNFNLWLEKAKQSEYEELASKVRAKRDALLADTDKDATVDRIINKYGITDLAEIKELPTIKYRQALRDIPQQEGFPYNVSFPAKPQ